MKWLEWTLRLIYARIFGCFHRHTTWPHRNPAGFDYLRCLDCGVELPYSLLQMRIVTSEELLQERNHETGERPNGPRRGLRAGVQHEERLSVPQNIRAHAGYGASIQ